MTTRSSPASKRLSWASAVLALGLCSATLAQSGTSGSTTTAAQRHRDHQIAMTLWRNDIAAKHPKGSCASCHGADFFDLARIGTPDTDIIRRAVIDGATPEEAEALRRAVLAMREQMRLPRTNPRQFRPFQPGGSVLRPELASEHWIPANVQRDVAFAEQLRPLMPTWYGARIGTLAQAQRAREEMLDVARGTNTAGANTRRVQLRDLRVGFDYPLWSADKAHGAHEGTYNDWLSDLGFIPKPDQKVAWEALQNAYLANPNNHTFWAMYEAAGRMLQLATPLGACTAPSPSWAGGAANIRHETCARAEAGFKQKFKSALIGQHMLRMQAMGRLREFVNGPLAFAYLDTDARYRPLATTNWGGRSMLPSPLWEVGDLLGRVVLGGPDLKTLGPVSASLGLPKFVVDSIDANRSSHHEEQELRLAWMWLGFTFDPSFARMNAGNATRVGEYMVATLLDRKLFNHNAFMTHMRLMASTYLPEASTTHDRASPTGVRRVANDRLHEVTHYSYFLAYSRNRLGSGHTAFTERGMPAPPPAAVDRATQLWSAQVSNGMRTTLILLRDELQNRPQGLNRDWLQRTAADIQRAGAGAWLTEFRQHWSTYQPQHAAADDALVQEVARLIVQRAASST